MIDRMKEFLRSKKFLLFFLLALLVFFLARLGVQEKNTVHMQQITKPSDSAAKRVGIESSAAYTEKIDTYAKQKVVQAKTAGTSFVSPISHERKVALKEKNTEEAPKTNVTENKSEKQTLVPKTQETKTRRRQYEDKEKNSDRSKRIQDALERLEKHEYTQQKILVLAHALPEKAITEKAITEKTTTPKNTQEEKKTNAPKIGTMLYGISRLAINSDAPGPCVVEIVAQPFLGAKVFGSFSAKEESLHITFSQLITKDGERIPIQAYAIDPNTDTTALKTHIDRHLIERYAALFAASFLEGFGSAVRTSGQQATTTLYGTATKNPVYSLGDQILIALGKVGERTAHSLEPKANRNPTITLDAGTHIGVLITDVFPQTQTKNQYQKNKID